MAHDNDNDGVTRIAHGLIFIVCCLSSGLMVVGGIAWAITRDNVALNEQRIARCHEMGDKASGAGLESYCRHLEIVP